MNERNIFPFVKWIGGKRQLLSKFLKRVPIKFNTYIEPFVGGGALFFALRPKKAIINDINKELINAYKVIKTKHNLLVEFLTIMKLMGHKSETFYELRNMDRKAQLSFPFKPSNPLKAARFIYLNKAGFNGMYRVNKNGKFNVPNGKKSDLTTHCYQNLNNIADFIKNNDIKIFNQPFQKICLQAKKGDFVYFDPPYDYEIGQNGFDSYSKNEFAKKGQKLLARICQDLHSKGVKFMVSNHNTILIQNLYKDFKIEIFKAKRLIGGKNASRKDVEEVLIRNYE